MASEESQQSLQRRVHDICNQLHADGTKVTVRRVLSMLPDVKSTSTVHKYHKVWKNELEAGQKSLYEKLGFSHEFTAAFTKEITRFSAEAEKRHREKADSAEEAHDAAVEALEILEQRHAQQQSVLELAQKEVKELQGELIAVQKEAKVEFEKYEASSQAIADGLRKQMEELQVFNKDLQESNEGLRTNVAKAELKLEGNQDYVTEVKARNDALTQQLEQLRVDNTKLAREVASYESNSKGQEKLIAQLESSIGQERESYRQLDHQLQRQETQKAEDSKVIDSLNTQVKTLQEQLTAERRRTAEQSAIIAKFTK